jgi:diguanylate cyclase (GGDEF)-like protein
VEDASMNIPPPPERRRSGDGDGAESGRDGRRLRFHLNVQKSRASVYTLGVAVGLLDRFVGELPTSYAGAAFFLLLANLSALAFHELYRRGADRRLGVGLDPFWMACDLGLVTFAVYLSGGQPEYFVWYLANVSAAAFVGGFRTALIVALADIVAYLGVLAALGQVTGFDGTLVRPVIRMAYLFGAAFFMLRGISSLRDERRLVKRMHREESRKVEELTRLSQELHRRTDELNAANARLVDTAATDPLTGLRNRRFLESQLPLDVETVKRAWGDAQRGRARPRNGDLGFVLLDLDHFKRVNDTYGHDAGDAVLRTTSETLRQCLRANDALIRWGGEEFLFLLRHTNGEFMPLVAKRLLRAVAAQKVAIANLEGPLRVTTSIGWSFFPLFEGSLEDQGWEDVLELADRALYLAKGNGRNMAVGLVAGPNAGLRAPLRTLVSDLPGALRAGHLELVSTGPVAKLETT